MSTTHIVLVTIAVVAAWILGARIGYNAGYNRGLTDSAGASDE